VDAVQVLSPFGARPVRDLATRELHEGVDLSAPAGAEVRAAAAGVVAYAGRRPVLDWVVIVAHADRWHTVYGNLVSVAVTAGDTVKAGDLLGHVGSGCDSGGASCLHFETRHEGGAVDPQSVGGWMR
jgi:murein DD-endopeptidase MepM/ murein hydrolase activator NlpD